MGESDSVFLWVESAGNMKHGCGKRSRYLEKAAGMLSAPTAAACTMRSERRSGKRQPRTAIMGEKTNICHSAALFSADTDRAANSSTECISTKEVAEKPLV